MDDVYEYAQDPEWARFLPVPQPYLRSDAEEFVARQLAASWPDEPSWAIVLEGKVIGALNLHDLNSERRIVGLGYAVARARWSQGFATEAAKAAIAAAFRSLGLKRIWAMADVRNIASQRVMEKAGMTRKRLVQEDASSVGHPWTWCSTKSRARNGRRRERKHDRPFPKTLPPASFPYPPVASAEFSPFPYPPVASADFSSFPPPFRHSRESGNPEPRSRSPPLIWQH